MKNYLFLALVLLFSGCATYVPPKQVADLETISQNPSSYTDTITPKYIYQEDFFDRYYKIWQSGITNKKEDIAWGFNVYSEKNSYGINLKPLKKEFFQKLKISSNFDDFKSINRAAITVKYVNLRVFPTSDMLFKDPQQAGEGFPFDYMQNSSLAPNEPIYISHFSSDKEWAYAFSSYASGWIKSDDFAYMSDDDIKAIREAKKVFIAKDGFSLLSQNGSFLFKSRVGMVLPLVEDEGDFLVLAFSATQENAPIKNYTLIPKDIGFLEFATFEPKHIELVIDELIKDRYGWGGMFEQRDCSSMMRDYFGFFGYFLPRNSAAQARVGDVISLKGLSEKQKIELIKKEAIPFRTILFRRGHVVLYVGSVDGEIIVFHNTWGVRTKEGDKIGRFIVGEALFSTLKLGGELKNADSDSTLLKTIESMNILR
ncbi:MAG: SH3 domain-containing protein [Sulfurimonas sp.]|nr:SH3 domain-containing protein [Sulfurimonadaceae bacterium]